MRMLLLFLLGLLPLTLLHASDQMKTGLPLHAPTIHFQNEFEEFLTTVIAEDTPGIAVTIVIDGETILTRGYGVSQVGGINQIDTETVFRLASVSKTIAAAAVGSLVQHNKLQWNSRLKDYIDYPNFKNPQYAEQLTIQHLLSHRTGLIQHAYTNLVEDNISYENILSRMKEVPFACPPGTCYGYQNVVFSLVGDVIEASSNETFDNFVTDNLFNPLDMKNASYGMENFLNTKNRATPHIRNGRAGPWKPVTVNENFYRIAPAAGANASINDMNHWLLAQMGHYQHVINSDTLNAMHEKNVRTKHNQSHYQGDNWQNKVEDAYYGLGWRVFDYEGRQNYVHHGGWVQGSRAEIVFHSGLQMGMVFLTNSETRLANQVVPMFLQLYSAHILQKHQD